MELNELIENIATVNISKKHYEMAKNMVDGAKDLLSIKAVVERAIQYYYLIKPQWSELK